MSMRNNAFHISLGRHTNDLLLMAGSTTGPPRWEFCITEIIRFFPHGSDFLLAHDRKEKRSTVAGSDHGVDPAVTTVSNATK